MLTLPTLEASPTLTYLDEVTRRARAAHQPDSVSRAPGEREKLWVEVPADEVGEALMQAWAVNGVDYLFFSSGSDLGWFQETAVKLKALGRPTPRIITMLHENTNLNAATGYAGAGHRPSLTAAHIDLGLMNYGAAIMSAARGNFPVMMTSGKSPNSYGSLHAPGGRDQAALFRGDMPDYGSIVRNYVKWDHELKVTDTPGLVISRALQIGMTQPLGPSYMAIPRDVAMRPIQGSRFPTVAQLGIPEPPAGDPDAIHRAAQLLLDADNPLVLVQRGASDPRAFDCLIALAELLGLPISDGQETANFPTDHPLYEGGPKLSEADVILAIEAFIPWIPGFEEPAAEAKVIGIGVDPIFSKTINHEFESELLISGGVARILHQLYEEADRLLTSRRRDAIAERTARISARSAARRQRAIDDARAQANQTPISGAYAAWCLGQVLEDDTVMLPDSVTNGQDLKNHVRISQPDTVFKAASAAGGWGTGAALGVKLAKPDKFVVHASGDGFFLYGVPYASLWASARYNAPFLTLVFQNRAYSTGTTAVARHYPEGYSVKENEFEGGTFDPPVDLAKLAEASGAHGENVTDPAQVLPALQRAAKMVREGTPALVSVEVKPLVR